MALNELSTNWEVVKLEDVCLKITDGEHLKPATLDSGVYFLSAKDITDNDISFDNPLYVSINDALRFREKCNPEKNDVLLVSRGNIGKSCVVKSDKLFCLLGSVILIKVKKTLDPKFLDFIFKSLLFQEALKNLCGSTVLKAIYIRDIKKLQIPLPPLVEQQRIVAKLEELFSELDAGVESLKTAQVQLKTYRQAVWKWAFEGKLTNEDLHDGELLKNWKWVKLGDVIEQPKYGTSKKCDYSFQGKAVLRIPNIADGFIDSSDLKFASFDEKEIEMYCLKEGDLLTIRSNGSVDLVGKCALIAKKDEDFLYAGYLIRLRPLNEILNPKFLLNVLSSGNLRKQIETKAKSTSGVNNINSNELKSLIIPLCSLEEQQRIVQEIESRLSVCDKLEEIITTSLRQAEALRQSILKKAFEGKLVAQDNGEEVVELAESVKLALEDERQKEKRQMKLFI